MFAKKPPDGFETSGTLLLNGGRLKQTLKLTSIGDQTVVYEDRVVAVSDVTVNVERGVPTGIENDEFTGRSRIVSDQDGHKKYDWRQSDHPILISGTWANIDGRLGVVMLAGSGIAYQQGSGYSPGISVCSDILYGSFSDQPRAFKAGEEVAHRVAVFFVEATAEETSALAKDCRIETKPGGSVLHLKQPNGKETEVPLL